MFRLINKLKNKKGFTLIELIVVLAVLAIIMAIAVPKFTGVQKQAKIDSDKATLDSIAKLAELEYVRLNGVVDSSDVSNLIESNFSTSNGKLFQSDELKTFDARTVVISFDANGNVVTIKGPGTSPVFTYTLSNRTLTTP